MDWPQLIEEVAKRGWTLTFGPAHFSDGIGGCKVELSVFDAEEDQPPIYEIIRVDDEKIVPETDILGAALRLFGKLDAG